MQKGDAVDTYGLNKKICKKLSIKFEVDLSQGVFNFIKWYKNYYKLD